MKTILWLATLFFFQSSFANALIIQNADRANVAKLHKNNYLLTLTNPSAYVDFYVKNSTHKAGILALNKFLSLWNHDGTQFFDHPPNASLALINDKGDYQNADVIVTNPSFGKGTISYQITTINTSLYLGKIKHIVLIFDNIPFNFENL